VYATAEKSKADCLESDHCNLQVFRRVFKKSEILGLLSSSPLLSTNPKG